MLLSRGLRKVLDCQVVRLDTKRGTNIVAAYIPFKRDTKPTILFSHGNAVDLALMLPFYRSFGSSSCALPKPFFVD